VIVPLAAGELHQHWSGWLAGLATKVAEQLFSGRATEEDIEFVEASLHAWVFVIPLLIILCLAGTRQMTRVPGRLQNVLELVVQGLTDFCRSIIGPLYSDRFVPFIGGLFVYIFMMNLWGIVPGMAAATSTVNTTAALALCTFVVTHYAGFRYGKVEYLKHFAGEPLWLAPLMVPIHIIGELARPLSLTLRLFGNIGGEEKAVAIFVSLGVASGAFLPFQLPLTALGIFTSFVQALIFCLLSSVYIGGALPHAHGEDHGHDHGHGHEPHGHDELAGREGLHAIP
jgi:F-type H+-transporting ATPase subunit a